MPQAKGKIVLNREGLQREIEFLHVQMRKLADICEHQDKQLRVQAKAIKRLSAREDYHYREVTTAINDLTLTCGSLVHKVLPGARKTFAHIGKVLKVDFRKPLPADNYNLRPDPKKRDQ